jgi:hypothetical protein
MHPIPRIDSKTGQFLPTPEGQKPPKMKEMEEKLGLDFEEDYREKYLEGKLGQKRFSQRWGVSRNLIFANNLRGGRRSWIQMLALEKKGHVQEQDKGEKELPSCEICGEEVSLDKAHWKEHTKGGSTKAQNILNLCPNCHRKLDRGDKYRTEKGREVLLFREAKKIFDKKITEETPKKLLDLCEQIILERRN